MVNGQKQSLNLGQSPDGRQPSPLTSPLLTDTGFVRTDDEDEVRRKVCLLEREQCSRLAAIQLVQLVALVGHFGCLLLFYVVKVKLLTCCKNVILNLANH